jgi:hypothetical protein
MTKDHKHITSREDELLKCLMPEMRDLPFRLSDIRRDKI